MMGKPLRCCNYSLSNAKESTTIHSSSKHGRSPIHNGLLCPSSLSIQSVSISVNLCQSVSICANSGSICSKNAANWLIDVDCVPLCRWITGNLHISLGSLAPGWMEPRRNLKPKMGLSERSSERDIEEQSNKYMVIDGVYIMELCGITMACSGVETWFRLLESSGLSTKWFSWHPFILLFGL